MTITVMLRWAKYE